MPGRGAEWEEARGGDTPAPRLANDYPKTVRMAEPELHYPAVEQVDRTHEAFQHLKYPRPA